MKKRLLFVSLGLLVLVTAGIAVYVGFGLSEPKYDDRRLSYWLYELNSTNYQKRDLAAFAISKIGQPAVPRLIDALEQRPTASERLHRFLSEKCPPVISSRVPKPLSAVDVQFNAAVAVAALGPAASNAVPALLTCLTSTNAAVLSRSKYALGKVGDAAVPILLDTLTSHTNPLVRVQAITALRQFSVTNLDSATVQRAIDAAVPLLDSADARRFQEARDTLRQFRPQALIALSKHVDHPDPVFRGRVAVLLVEFGRAPTSLVRQLIEGLNARELDTRMGAVQSLAKIDTAASTAIPALTELAASTNNVRKLCGVMALARIKRDWTEATPLALQMLKGTDTEAGQAAFLWLSAHPPPPEQIMPVLLELMQSRTMQQSMQAYSLANRYPPQKLAPAVPELVALLKSTKDIRTQYNIVNLFARMGPDAREALPALRELTESPDLYLKTIAGGAIGRINPEEAGKYGFAQPRRLQIVPAGK
ncbi:MAG: HEAT repeat domain-containing protein [Verrucomicrobiota bacterium]